MAEVTTVVAGVVAAVGAVAAYRYAKKRMKAFRSALRSVARGEKPEDAVIDFERDPETGVYRAK